MKSKKLRLRSKKKVKRTRKFYGGTSHNEESTHDFSPPITQELIPLQRSLSENLQRGFSAQLKKGISSQWESIEENEKGLTGRLKKNKRVSVNELPVIKLPLYLELAVRKKSKTENFSNVSTQEKYKKYVDEYTSMVDITRNAEYFSPEFISGMYDNCFCFIDLDILSSLFFDIGGKGVEKSDIRFLQPRPKIEVDNDTFAKSGQYTNSIVFKGDPVTGGHYVYVDHHNNVHGTYEELILLEKDDGVCHFYALIMALQYNSGGNLFNIEMFFHVFRATPITFTSFDTLHHRSTVINQERRDPFLIIKNYYLILGFIRYVIVQPVWVEYISSKTESPLAKTKNAYDLLTDWANNETILYIMRRLYTFENFTELLEL